MGEKIQTPKVFISYSWTTPEHADWVRELATELMDNQVDVILDQWELEEGQDKFEFMERMVTDEDVDKVIIVSDERYSRRADNRQGGVGTETQIISPELYERVNSEKPQEKFVALVTEKRDDGKAYLPTYLRGRIYIDMSTPEMRVDKFDELLRWTFDQPLHEKPELGKAPAHLFKSEGPNLGTSSRARRAMKLIREGNAAAHGAVKEYFDTVAANFERFEVERTDDRPFDEVVLESIEHFLPYRDELVECFKLIAIYQRDDESIEAVRSFFEKILPYKLSNRGAGQPQNVRDNFCFIIRELFLFCVAILIKNKRFVYLKYLLDNLYYVYKEEVVLDHGYVDFTYLDCYNETLDKIRNERLKLNLISVSTNKLIEREKKIK